jgi:hypothetical protein
MSYQLTYTTNSSDVEGTLPRTTVSHLTYIISFDEVAFLVPFLPVRDEFHPKRNQARQKLATLPSAKFEDLCSDVYFEIMRRYPEFTEVGSFILNCCLIYAKSGVRWRTKG